MADTHASFRTATRPSWDPRREKCITALTTTGDDTCRHNLVSILQHADDVRDISADTPGEYVALIEYLLAICYAFGAHPVSQDAWVEWIRTNHSLSEAADGLDKASAEEWDLFHPTAPLGQNALLAPYLNQRGAGPAQLVIERVGDYNQFLDHHHLEHPTPLPADQAFRAMLTQHAYGPGGRARISGKETLGPTITNLAVGRLGARIRVLALGATLGDTLRLNLAPPRGASGTLNLTWTSADSPRRGFRTKPAGRHVNGPADLHSVLGRSILMRPVVTVDGEYAVDRVLMGAGELLAPLPDHYQQDVVYLNTAQGTPKPLWPSLSRVVWREAHALYAAVAERDKGEDLYGRLARLPARHIRLRAIGLVAKQATAVTWVSDSFPFVPGRERVLRFVAEQGSVIAEYVASSLYKAAFTAWTIAYPGAKSADKSQQVARFDASHEHWNRAAESFHTALETIAADDPEPTADVIAQYATELREAATYFLGRRLDSLPANSRGFQARAAALRRLDAELDGPKAPEALRGST